jgi:hypothetical protein
MVIYLVLQVLHLDFGTDLLEILTCKIQTGSLFIILYYLTRNLYGTSKKRY